MTSIRRLFLALVMATTYTTPALAEFTPLKLDRVHSRIGFTASTFLFDVEGAFSTYEVLVDGDFADPTHAKVKVDIAVPSVDTGNQKRDEHLRGPDFFDAERFPAIRFESKSIRKVGKTVTVMGTLDMHGRQKVVTIPFAVVTGKNGAGVATTAFRGKLTLDRSSFGVGADSVAARISLDDAVALEILLVVTE